MEILTIEEILEHVNGGLFPTGEFVSGVCCPRCGDRDNLIKGESFQASYLTPSIEKIITDKTVTVYSCPICGMKFMTYGPFYHFGKSTTPDQLDQTWVNCLNLFGVEYNA